MISQSDSFRKSYILAHDCVNFVFFFRMLAQSYRQTFLYPTPISLLLYYPFTIVLHNRLNTYLFRTAHTPARQTRAKRNKDPHPTPQPTENPAQASWPTRIHNKKKEATNRPFRKEANSSLKAKCKLNNLFLCCYSDCIDIYSQSRCICLSPPEQTGIKTSFVFQLFRS